MVQLKESWAKKLFAKLKCLSLEAASISGIEMIVFGQLSI
jgi:hypothetical protein